MASKAGKVFLQKSQEWRDFDKLCKRAARLSKSVFDNEVEVSMGQLRIKLVKNSPMVYYQTPWTYSYPYTIPGTGGE